MERYSANYQGGRSMCGSTPGRGDMRSSCMTRPMPVKRETDSCPCPEKNNPMYECLETLPVAMAYVPYQKYTTAFDLCYALKVGTIFPELCKPFCGKGGKGRC
ncbi:MAG: spore coat associated protein CotJA [Eubacteriales bacterium]|nr:spore coat associated protein CotJA [Eubacteriales bacterium]